MPRREEQLDSLHSQLKRWGSATVARLALHEDGPSAGDSILAQQRDMGLKSKRKADDEHEIVGRAGKERRRYMGAKTSTAKLQLVEVPQWAVDPVPARNDASRPFTRDPIPIDLVPDDLHWINQALARLSRESLIRELIVREEFCGTGTQRMKAERVARAYGGSLTVRQYRYELQRALDWLEGKRAA